MNAPERIDDLDAGMVTAESGTVALLNRSEIDMQIATAHKYPRSISQFRRDVMDMVTISEAVAQECIYAVPRDGKVIEGPSARFAEVVASAWGNGRAGARVVSDAGDFVTAQGVYHDLQKNVAITYEVQRRITGRNGCRFSPDMIGVTANAACSIALRNAILKGIPKAFWADMYEGARRTAMGDVKTLPNRRAEAFKALQGYGISKEQVLAKLGLQGDADIGQEQLLTLRGLLTAIKDGDTTPEQAFAPDDGAPLTPRQAVVPSWAAADFSRHLAQWSKAIEAGMNSVGEILAMARSKGALTTEQEATIRAIKKDGMERPAPMSPEQAAFLAKIDQAEAAK